MKILHTSDWHLGISFRGRDSVEDQEFFLDRICEIIKERKIDAVILAGDVFDRAVASSEAVAFYDRAMTRIVAGMDTDLICVAGNHDGASRLSQCSALLRKSGLYISGILGHEIEKISYDDTDIFLLPWFTAERARAAFPERADEITDEESAYRTVCDEIRRVMEPGRKNILVTHAFVTGAETSESDRAAEIGSASAVPVSVFEGFDYVALGHIHKHQEIGANAVYSGSPMPYSFGKEEKQAKGVVVVDTDAMIREFVEIPVLRKRSTITADYDTIIRADYPEEVRKGYVRLEVTDRAIGTEAMALFTERYPLLLEARGKSFDNDESGITLTIEEFEKRANDPMQIFDEFCRDMKFEKTLQMMENFKKAVEEYGKEVQS